MPVDLAEDSMFPFQTNSAVPVKISFTVGDNKLKIEKWDAKKSSDLQVSQQTVLFNKSDDSTSSTKQLLGTLAAVTEQLYLH